jgi:hypothetical protein
MNSPFFITLASNASENSHIGDFKISLPYAITLRCQYEIALHSIILPLSQDIITSFPESNGFMENQINLTFNSEVYSVFVQNCSFTSGAELASIINNAIKKRLDVITNGKGESPLVYDRLTKRCHLRLVDNLTEIQFSERLAYFLGYNRTVSSFPCDAKFAVCMGHDLAYIYANDLVEPQILCNVKAPILKVISLPPGNGENIEINVTKPQYLPLRTNELKTIWIQIKNDKNQVIPFNSGKTLLVLHCRPLRNQSIY